MEALLSLPILIPYIIVGYIIGAFAQDDGTLERLGPLGCIITLFIIVAWPLFFFLIWLFGEDGVFTGQKSSNHNHKHNRR